MSVPQASAASNSRSQCVVRRPGYLSNAPYARAYVRSVLAVLTVLGLFPLAIGSRIDFFVRNIMWYGNPMSPEEARELAVQTYTMFDVDAGLLEQYVDAVASVVTWFPITALLVGGLVVTLLLEVSTRR